jgi:hypothetical protein
VIAVVVRFPAAGAYPYELDYAKGGDKYLTLTMTAYGQPIPAASLLTLTPVAPTPSQVGQIQQLQLMRNLSKRPAMAVWTSAR